MPDHTTIETLQRVRRIETRLTQLMVAQGVPVNAQMPTYQAEAFGLRGTMQVPSPHTSIKALLDAIPQDCGHPVDIYLGETLLMRVVKPGSS